MRVPIRFDSWYGLLSAVLLLPPSLSYLDVGEQEEEVRMGWAFRARFPRTAVARVSRFSGRPISRGVHGMFGRWLVNGAGDRVAAIQLEPVQRARVMGVPVRLRELLVSVDDPEDLAQRLQAR